MAFPNTIDLNYLSIQAPCQSGPYIANDVRWKFSIYETESLDLYIVAKKSTNGVVWEDVDFINKLQNTPSLQTFGSCQSSSNPNNFYIVHITTDFDGIIVTRFDAELGEFAESTNLGITPQGLFITDPNNYSYSYGSGILCLYREDDTILISTLGDLYSSATLFHVVPVIASFNALDNSYSSWITVDYQDYSGDESEWNMHPWCLVLGSSGVSHLISQQISNASAGVQVSRVFQQAINSDNSLGTLEEIVELQSPQSPQYINNFLVLEAKSRNGKIALTVYDYASTLGTGIVKVSVADSANPIVFTFTEFDSVNTGVEDPNPSPVFVGSKVYCVYKSLGDITVDFKYIEITDNIIGSKHTIGSLPIADDRRYSRVVCNSFNGKIVISFGVPVKAGYVIYPPL